MTTEHGCENIVEKLKESINDMDSAPGFLVGNADKVFQYVLNAIAPYNIEEFNKQRFADVREIIGNHEIQHKMSHCDYFVEYPASTEHFLWG